MRFHHENDQIDNFDEANFSEIEFEEDAAVRHHKKRVRQMLEDRLERKRLKAELEDLDEDEFDWDDFDSK